MSSWLDAREILAILPDNIDEVVMLGPVLRAPSPGTRITLLASPAGAHAAPLLPWVDDGIVERNLRLVERLGFAARDRQMSVRHTLLRRLTPCQPCYLFTCPIGQPCLMIPPEQAAAAAESLLAERRQPATSRTANASTRGGSR